MPMRIGITRLFSTRYDGMFELYYTILLVSSLTRYENKPSECISDNNNNNNNNNNWISESNYKE
jgi:hypothetical protein